MRRASAVSKRGQAYGLGQAPVGQDKSDNIDPG